MLIIAWRQKQVWGKMTSVDVIFHKVRYWYCFHIIIKLFVLGSLKISKMCLILCLLESIVRVTVTILLMLDSIFRMLLYNVYNLLSVFCQICSILPLCVVFIVTSKLKCLLCNRSNICCAGAQANCPLLTSLTTILVLYFVFYAFGAVDSIFNVLGYVKEHKNQIQSTSLNPVNITSTYITSYSSTPSANISSAPSTYDITSYFSTPSIDISATSSIYITSYPSTHTIYISL